MVEIRVLDSWREAHPGGVMGFLVMENAQDQGEHTGLDEARRALEEHLRQRYAGVSRAELKAIPPLDAYTAYYKRYDKTYHVLLQLESVAHKGKPIPDMPGAVQAVFMAELESQVLTAGHDLDACQGPLEVGAATGGEGYLGAAGREQALKPRDMYMADRQGVICSVLYGEDQRTRITAQTRNLLYVVYGPPGVGETVVRRHLEGVAHNVRLYAPQAVQAMLQTVS
ncbi:MAG: hypothetical protein VB089_12875 [Anaerolineaceae bacterium]|nr:hypothetical protein [Anaerolineaceae bacterium]